MGCVGQWRPPISRPHRPLLSYTPSTLNRLIEDNLRSIFIIENTCLDQPHQKRIYRLAYKYMANHEDAEDIVQEVLFRLWNHSSHIASEAMEVWISQTTRNACLDALRRRKSYCSVVSTQDCELALQNTPAIEVNLLQYIGMREALNRLEPPHRTLILLRYFKGLPCEAISQELGMPLSTVKVYLHRGRRHLRALLDSTTAD